MVDHPGIWLGGQSGLGEGSHLVLGLGARRVISLLAKEGGDRVSPLSWVSVSPCALCGFILWKQAQSTWLRKGEILWLHFSIPSRAVLLPPRI